MFEIIEPGDGTAELEEKLRKNGAKFLEIQAEYNDVQYWINQAIALVYAEKLEEAKKKPDTQGVN
jgi:hypothetical protein